MIIKIQKEKLIEPLKNLVGVAEKRQTMPILGNVLFRADKQKLLIVGSDLEVEISTRIDYMVDGELNTTLPGRKLLDILKSLPGEEDVTIDFNDEKATIKSGKSRFVLASLPGSDFPYDKEDIDYGFKVAAGSLDNLISQTAFSMAVQDARHFLNGMFFEVMILLPPPTTSESAFSPASNWYPVQSTAVIVLVPLIFAALIPPVFSAPEILIS